MTPLTANTPGALGPAGAVARTLASQVETWPGAAAAGVVAVDGPSGIPRVVATAGSIETIFRWASVSKLLVSLASLVAVEEGTVSLMDAAGPPGSTLSHLLSHASGLPFEGNAPMAAPGRRRIYSNTGMEVAAAYLATAATMPFAEYLQAGVLDPLEMNQTAVDGSPAHGARGPLVDLLALAREFLTPRLVSVESRDNATAVAWPGLAGVVPGFGRYDPCDWGLGPEIRSQKSPHWTGKTNSPATFGHFGQSGSFIWVDPVANVAVAGLSETPFGPWAKQAWPALADAVLVEFHPPPETGGELDTAPEQR
jgi:CubicO group peptidase (beta-lactamase class C family)